MMIRADYLEIPVPGVHDVYEEAEALNQKLFFGIADQFHSMIHEAAQTAAGVLLHRNRYTFQFFIAKNGDLDFDVPDATGTLRDPRKPCITVDVHKAHVSVIRQPRYDELVNYVMLMICERAHACGGHPGIYDLPGARYENKLISCEIW
jgi:hypothetical protein